MENVETIKREVLAKYLHEDNEVILDILIEDIETKDNELFVVGHNEYLVLTDEEADMKAADYIRETAWAFNKSFLDCHSKSISELDEKTFSIIQDSCESANKAILAMIDDVEHFIEDAILADGRGHFLGNYDGKENEQDNYYIYRVG